MFCTKQSESLFTGRKLGSAAGVQAAGAGGFTPARVALIMH